MPDRSSSEELKSIVESLESPDGSPIVFAAYARGAKPYIVTEQMLPTAQPSPVEYRHNRVRLMNEYVTTWPLWFDDRDTTPQDFPQLSETTRSRLVEWAESFNNHFDPFTLWDSPDVAAEHEKEARALEVDVQAELGPDYEVVLKLWELPKS